MRACCIAIALLAILASSCDEALPPELTGFLQVSVTTTGGDLDEDGYEVSLDGAPGQPIGANGMMVIPGLSDGPHDVALAGVAVNCMPDTGSARSPQVVSITGGDTTEVAFGVHCVATGVEVATPTTGPDPDPDGYSVSVDGGPPQRIEANGTLTISRLSDGSHTVALGDVAENCVAVDPNPRVVTLAMGDVAAVTFDVSCVAVTGSVQVTATTSGTSLDPNGYTVQVQDRGIWHVSTNGVTTIEGLAAGPQTLLLADVAANCTVGGDNPRTVSVTTGDSIRDTVRTTFDVACLPTTGTVEVSTATAGDAPDPDGYTAIVTQYCEDWVPCLSMQHAVDPNGVVTFESVPPDYYYVRLDDVARNCLVGVPRAPLVQVAAADTVRVGFAVSCPPPGALALRVATTGNEPDPQYTVSVQGIGFDTALVVAANATTTISDVPARDYNVSVGDVAFNCDLTSPNPATVSVPGGDTATVQVDVVCASPGSVQLTVTTTGLDPDPDGYTFHLSGTRFGSGGAVADNETITISGVPAGDYTVRLDSIAVNCDLTGADPATVTVPDGGTGTVIVSVACTEAGSLAMTVDGDVYVVKVNGTSPARLTVSAARNAEPAWSPDGGRIAFVSERDGNAEIYVMNPDGSSPMRLTTNGVEDADPAWSPDGSRIAFTSRRDGNAEIYVMQADGSSPVRLTSEAADDFEPSWSPDGGRIAFVSERDGNAEIYVMDAGGTGAIRLTSDTASDRHPAWSPDGSRLVFSHAAWCFAGLCDYDLYVMYADGSGRVRVRTADAYYEISSDASPSWSPDGRWIVFGASHLYCDYFCTLSYSAVEAVRADGSRVEPIWRAAAEPAWRP